MNASRSLSAATLLAQAGHYLDDSTGAVVPPLHPTTTFARDSDYQLIGDYIYSRTGDPNSTEVARLLVRLDGGADAMLFASGMAAIAALIETVPSGRRIIAPEVMYFGTLGWLRRVANERAIELRLFDPTHWGALEAALASGSTDLVLIETPVNPTWHVIDIQAAAAAAHKAGALLAVDSTVAPPVTTRPIDLGADIVIHSATKYLNGHSDLIAGVLVTKQLSNRWEELRFVREHAGGVLGSFESWLLLRGLRTLAIRFERSSNSALQVAQHFQHHSKLKAVLYPGLESHPGHEIAKRQMTSGFGGMLSFLVKGGAEAALQVATGLRVIRPATSLGGVESLVEHRASIEGPESAVPVNLLRFSIGIEDPEDLIADLDQALAAV